jgi:hypothetical protein
MATPFGISRIEGNVHRREFMIACKHARIVALGILAAGVAAASVRAQDHPKSLSRNGDWLRSNAEKFRKSAGSRGACPHFWIGSKGELPVEAALIPLPLGAVEPDGWLRDWAIAARDGITGHLDEYHPTFHQ